MPVCVTRPPVTAKPCSWVAASSSPQVSPAPNRPLCRSASIATLFIGPVSITIPPSQLECPGVE